MTNKEQEFMKRWQAAKPAYRRWGDLVLQRLHQLIAARVPASQAGNFSRIPSPPRLKDDQSLLQKAFFRPEKNYLDPFNDIEDKVGVRLVLLLDEDVRMMAQAIETETEFWTAVRARDHEAERELHPYEFVYQSVHFVVRSKSGLFFEDGAELPEDIPCEVQVRTLLQHAHSEITHDTLYKPSIKTTSSMKRAAAKSMALIEATADYFSQLNKLIAEQVDPLKNTVRHLSEQYIDIVAHPPGNGDTPLDGLILDRYTADVALEDLTTWLSDKRWIGSRIAEHMELHPIFKLPTILLVYFKVGIEPMTASVNCPIPDQDLQLIYSDLGMSMYG